MEGPAALSHSAQRERIEAPWFRATTFVSILLLLLFTLAQASHTHGSLSVAKGHHALASDAGQGGTAPDQCPLCAGGVGFLAPDGSLPDLSAALVFSVGGRTSPTYIRELDLPFALSSRPPPLP